MLDITIQLNAKQTLFTLEIIRVDSAKKPSPGASNYRVSLFNEDEALVSRLLIKGFIRKRGPVALVGEACRALEDIEE